VMNRQDLHGLLISDPVDDAIALQADLAEVVAAKLGDDLPRERESFEGPDRRVQTLAELPGSSRSIARDELADCVDVFDRLVRSPGRSTLLEPLGEPLPGFFVGDGLAGVGLLDAPMDLVKEVELLQGIVERGFVDQLVHGLER